MVLGRHPDSSARDDESAVELDALGGGRRVFQADGIRPRDLVIGARDGDFHGSAGNQGVAVAADAFPALSAVRDAERAAGHHEGGVGLDAGRRGKVGQVGIVHAAGDRQAGLSAVDAHRSVGRDGLLALFKHRETLAQRCDDVNERTLCKL